MAKKKDEPTIDELIQDPDVVIVEDLQISDTTGNEEKKENDAVLIYEDDIKIDSDEETNVEDQVDEVIEEEIIDTPEIIVHEIKVNFPNVGSRVTSVIQATGQVDELIAAGKRLKLIAGRFYYVPVNININSDDYANMKIMSDMADKIDVRFVRDNLACITPLMSGMELLNETRLCMIW